MCVAEIEFVIKTSQKSHPWGPIVLLQNSTKHLKKININFRKPFWGSTRRCNTSRVSVWGSISLTVDPEKTVKREEERESEREHQTHVCHEHRTLQQHVNTPNLTTRKKYYMPRPLVFIPSMQGWSNSWESSNAIHPFLQAKEGKSRGHVHCCTESVSRHSKFTTELSAN